MQEELIQQITPSLPVFLKIPSRKIKGGTGNWHLHLTIIGSVYTNHQGTERCVTTTLFQAPKTAELLQVLKSSAGALLPKPRGCRAAYQVRNHLLHVLSAFLHLILGASELHNITFLCWVWKVDDNLKQITRDSVELF